LYSDDITRRTLRLSDYLGPGIAYHVARVGLTPTDPMHAHDHDFAEVFWIERGSVVHLVNGQRQLLTQGDLALVRPEDTHTFRRHREEDFALVNVAFDRETLDFLRGRYFEGVEWPWQGHRLPAAHRLDRAQLARLGKLACLLVAGPPSRLLLERFLLELLDQLTHPSLYAELPQWLSEALTRLANDPEALVRGVPALAMLAGRGREHVNRVIRSSTGRTATDLVNEIRLSRAASDLRMTDQPIVQIARECGVANLSHFYRLFNARFGVTPRRYRLSHQSLVRGRDAMSTVHSA